MEPIQKKKERCGNYSGILKQIFEVWGDVTIVSRNCLRMWDVIALKIDIKSHWVTIRIALHKDK